MVDMSALMAGPKATLRTQAAPAPVIGETALSPYLPSDIVGGSVPYIAGSEDEAVWNAASQACATDKVHYVYTIADNRIWYLTTPSASLASNPDSWCPLAAALPGNSEYWDRETVYIYDQEGTAAGLRWDQETGRMQVFVGPSRTILPRLQTLDANFVTINLDRAIPVPWRNQSLREEMLSRATVKGLFWTGAAVAVLSLGFWLLTHLVSLVVTPDLAKAKQETTAASQQLMLQAAQTARNESDRYIFRLQELLNNLSALNGTLVKYEIKAGVLTWEALIPAAAGGENLTQLRAQAVGSSPDGRVRVRGKS